MNSREDDGRNQLQMWQNADRRVLRICAAFNEIQTSGNPLTRTEIRTLINKRPNVYGVLEKCAEPE